MRNRPGYIIVCREETDPLIYKEAHETIAGCDNLPPTDVL